MKTKKTVRCLCEGAVLLAISEILSLLPLYKLPWGGSVDLSMLPIFLFCIRWGLAPGLIISFAHGILQFLFAGGVAIGWQSVLGDYLAAYAVLGFTGLCKGHFVPGVLLGCFLRFLIHYVVGATIWAEYMPEAFFGLTMTTPWIYSALYNGAYILADCVLCLLIGVGLMKTPLRKFMTRTQ